MNALMWPTFAADDDVDALHRDAAPRSGIALDDQQPAVRGGARGLRRVALDPHGAAHHVLGDAGARVAVDGDLGLLVHPRGVVADVAVDGDRAPVRRAPTATLWAPRDASMTNSPDRPGACSAELTSRSGVVAQVECDVTVVHA